MKHAWLTFPLPGPKVSVILDTEIRRTGGVGVGGRCTVPIFETEKKHRVPWAIDYDRDVYCNDIN